MLSAQASAASAAFSAGTYRARMPFSAAASAMGSTPDTGRRVPSSASSPRKAASSGTSSSWPLAVSTASSRGKSYTGPVLRTSAGARLTVMRRSGNLKPRFLMAARTRSALSRTAESGRPTMEKAGSPPETSASTATAKPRRPFRPKLFVTEYMGAPRLHFLRENGRKLGGKIWEEPSAFDSISRSISL